MKKVIIASLAAFILFSVISCKKNSDNSTPSIEGKWYAQSLKASISLNGLSFGTIDSTLPGTGYYSFTGSNTFTADDLNGNTASGTYSYNASTKKLVTMDGSANTYYDVTSLTSTNMTLHNTDTTSSGGFTYITVSDIYFKK